MDGVVSIDKHLGAMESEDLFRLRDHLRELRQAPGWAMLVELVQVQHERSEKLAVHRGPWTPQGLDGLIRADAAAGHVSGYLKGLDAMAGIIDKVERISADVETALEAQEARDERS